MSGIEETGGVPRVEFSVPPSHCKTEVPGPIPSWAISIPRGGRPPRLPDDEAFIDEVLAQVGVTPLLPHPHGGDIWYDLARARELLAAPRTEFTDDDCARLRILLEHDGRGA